MENIAIKIRTPDWLYHCVPAQVEAAWNPRYREYALLNIDSLLKFKSTTISQEAG
jgi:hypothetical protein